jgi:EmrB/QacA subfamily drug resistance transporter
MSDHTAFPPHPMVSKETALLVASLASFLTPFMGSSINVALQMIGNELGASAVQLGWVPTSYLLTSSVLLIPIGRLADIYGRRKVFLGGILLHTLSSFLCGIAPAFSMLLAGRVLQGVSAAMMSGTGMAVLTSVFPAHERGKALGINTAAVYIGLSLGPTIGGVLTQQFGWRSIFLVNVPLGLVMALMVIAKMKGEWTEAKGARFDVAGTLLYCIGLVALMYGFSRLPGLEGSLLVAGGILFLLVFLYWESIAASPVLDITLFQGNRVFALSNLAAFINYGATFSISFLMSFYLMYVRGFTPQQAGMVLLAQPIVMAAASPFAGRLSDRVEPRFVASAGMGLIVAGLVFFSTLTETMPIAAIVTALAVVGLGFGLFSSPNSNAVMGSVERRVYGVAAGTLATMRMTGQTVSIGIAMMIFAVVIGPVQISPAVHAELLTAIRLAFGVSATLCLVGVFASLARGSARTPSSRRI